MQEILLSYLLILDIDSDTEEYPEQLHIEDTLFEPAGELKTMEVMMKLWRPKYQEMTMTFSKEIPTTPTSNLSDAFLDMITKPPF